MKETTKTLSFVGVAAGMVLLASLQYLWSKPKPKTDFGDIGQQFYAEFTEPKAAKSLEVYAMDEESHNLKKFRVEFKDGIWRIPSHFDYPAEAADRLAETAASVIGVRRESLAGRLPTEHERLGVVDPLDDSARDPQTVGKRLTLKDANGEVLADYIIGKEAGDVVVSDATRALQGDAAEKYYYVRVPDENQTYKVKLEVDLSTRFADWIQPDLLQLQDAAIVKVTVDNYQLTERAADPLGQVRQLIKSQGDQFNLSREGGFGPWSLDGLNKDHEEVDLARANQITNTVQDLKIVGVRPKFRYNNQSLLTADLRLNRIPELERNPREFEAAIVQVQRELSEKGFNLAPVAPNSEELMLVSHNGDLSVGADNGVVYTLHVGKPISGDEKTIEIGESNPDQPAGDMSSNPNADAKKVEDPKTPEEPASSNEPTAADESANQSADKTADEDALNRFVMIRVAFDDSLLGEKPIAPTKPEKPVEPPGYQPPPENKSGENLPGESGASADSSEPKSPTQPDPGTIQDESSSTDDQPGQDPATNDESSAGQAAQESPRAPEFVEYDQKLDEFEKAETDYELNLTRYENEKKAFEEKVERGNKRVKELNERFGAWYYVVSAQNLKSLQVTRNELIKEKKPGPTDLPPRPDITFPEDLEPAADPLGPAEK